MINGTGLRSADLDLDLDLDLVQDLDLDLDSRVPESKMG